MELFFSPAYEDRIQDFTHFVVLGYLLEDVLLSQSAPGHIAVAWGNWYSMVFIVSAFNAFASSFLLGVPQRPGLLPKAGEDAPPQETP